MDEVRQFCNRVLGPGPAADRAANEARRVPGRDRIELLAAAAEACRRCGDPSGPAPEPPRATVDRLHGVAADELVGVAADELVGVAADELAANVAHEMASALAKLPERQREVLALRELLRLSHQQIARVMAIDRAAVAPLIARSRLRLRAERRGLPHAEQCGCPDRERALRALVCRLDSEPLTAEDDRWVIEHIGACTECGRAHAAMLEASACYRVRPGGDAPRRVLDRVAAPSAG